jgi:hypothetical protein
MKSFKQFLENNAAAATQASISGSGSGEGSSDVRFGGTIQPFKKRPSLGIGGLAKGGTDRLKNRQGKPKPEQQKPGAVRNTAYVGQGVGRKDVVSRPKPGEGPSSKGRALPPGKERPALPAGKDSMVARRTAAAKQPPQHKQISARPASTAMAGSRQRPAIKPTKSNLSRDNMGVQKVKVRDEGPTQQKRLPPAQQRQLPPAKQRQLKAADG